MCLWVCWKLESSPRHLSSLIRSWLHPLPSCVVNDFGMPTLPLHLQSLLLFWDGAKLTVISMYECKRGPQGTCVLLADWEEALYFLSTPTQPTFSCLTFSSWALPFPCSGSGRVIRLHCGWNGAPIQARRSQKLSLVGDINPYRVRDNADPWAFAKFRPSQPSMHATAMRASSCQLLPPHIHTWKWEACLLSLPVSSEASSVGEAGRLSFRL